MDGKYIFDIYPKDIQDTSNRLVRIDNNTNSSYDDDDVAVAYLPLFIIQTNPFAKELCIRY